MIKPADLPSLRMCVAEATIDLNHAREVERLCRATTEQNVIEAAGGEKNIGANEEARKRALTIALHSDKAYIIAFNRLRAAESTLLRITSQLEAARDNRRSVELSARLALVAALGHDVQTDDGQFDNDFIDTAAQDIADDVLVQELEIAL